MIIGAITAFNISSKQPTAPQQQSDTPTQPRTSFVTEPQTSVTPDIPASPENAAPKIEQQKSEIWQTRNASLRQAGTRQLDSIGTYENPVEDLKTIHEILTNYLITLKTDRGLPTGTHQEIIAALRGNNPRDFEFIPPEHPQYDAQGRITDRWGSPIFFHAISSLEVQIISAGPDRELWTDDDLTYPSSEDLMPIFR